MLQQYNPQFSIVFHVLSTTHLSSFVFPCFPMGPHMLSLPLPGLLLPLSLSHTPFSLFNSLFQSKYCPTSSQRLSTSHMLFFFFFFPHCSPSAAPSACSCCDAAAGGAVELYSFCSRSLQFDMHVVATVRLTELKISWEVFSALGEKGCSSRAAAEIYFTLLLVRFSDKCLEILLTERNCRQQVMGLS